MTPTNPPIVELVVGVQFSTERPADSTRLVLFWNQHLRASYPNASEAPALEDTFEKFGDDVAWNRPGIRLSLESLPSIRFQYTNETNDRMVQLQPTRLIFNWMRRKSDYPRFSTLHAEFQNVYDSWEKFSLSDGVGEIVPNQWELCYVNFIPQGELWQTPGDWHKISPMFVAQVPSFEPLDFENRIVQWKMLMPGNTGRVTLTAEQVKNEQSKLGLQLTITARGPASTINECHERLSAAHDIIIELFEKLITPEAIAHWELTPS